MPTKSLTYFANMLVDSAELPSGSRYHIFFLVFFRDMPAIALLWGSYKFVQRRPSLASISSSLCIFVFQTFFFFFYFIFKSNGDRRGNCPKPYHYLPALFDFSRTSYEAHIGRLSKMIYRNLVIIGCHATVGALKEHGIFPFKRFLHSPHPLTVLLIFRSCSQFRSLSRAFFWKRLLRRLSDTCTNRFVEISCSVDILIHTTKHIKGEFCS